MTSQEVQGQAIFARNSGIQVVPLASLRKDIHNLKRKKNLMRGFVGVKLLCRGHF